MLDKAYDRLPTLRSRELRNNATEAERALWKHLRSRQLLGTRFNRQVPIGPFICDFVSRATKLVIELDGGQHADRSTDDCRRTQFLEAQGYRVIRFWNNDVLTNIEGVMVLIEAALAQGPFVKTPSRIAGGEEARSAEGEGLSKTGKTHDMPSPTPPTSWRANSPSPPPSSTNSEPAPCCPPSSPHP